MQLYEGGMARRAQNRVKEMQSERMAHCMRLSGMWHKIAQEGKNQMFKRIIEWKTTSAQLQKKRKRATKKKLDENDLDKKNPIKMWKSKLKTWTTADGYERCAIRKKDNQHKINAKHFYNKDERNSLSRAFFPLQRQWINEQKPDGTFEKGGKKIKTKNAKKKLFT